MDNVCFGVINYFKDWNNEGLFLIYRYVFLKLFVKLLWNFVEIIFLDFLKMKKY